MHGIIIVLGICDALVGIGSYPDSTDSNPLHTIKSGSLSFKPGYKNALSQCGANRNVRSLIMERAAGLSTTSMFNDLRNSASKILKTGS